MSTGDLGLGVDLAHTRFVREQGIIDAYCS